MEDCEDGVDNDLDGDVDCLDSDCAGRVDPCIELCGDGLDNDLDGETDCFDSDCAAQQVPCIEACVDGLDNDENGLVDCSDPHCSALEICSEDCADGVDNDGDGLVDCEDGSCSLQCTEQSCTDGRDNNANGRVDCADEDCWGLDGCGPAVGMRVLQGSAQVALLWSSSSASGSKTDQRSEILRVSNPMGTAVLGLSDSTLQCHWWADRMTLGWQAHLYRTYTWSGRQSTTSQVLSFENFDSTGACAPLLSQARFSTIDRNSATHAVTWAHQLHFGVDYASLDGARWAAGDTHFFSSTTWFGNTRTLFEIDPLHTEPWIFGP